MTDPTIASWSRENDLLFQLRRLREENERMSKRIEELEAMPKELDVKHKTKYYALLKEYDRVCYLLDKATDKITDQDLMLAIQTARIVDLQTHIENFDGEDR